MPSKKRKPPVKRLYPGLSIRNIPEPEPEAAEPEVPFVPAVEPPPESTPHGGLSNLASQVYRPRRDPITGKPLEVDAVEETRALLDVAPPIPSHPKPPVSNKFPSMRQTLSLDAE